MDIDQLLQAARKARENGHMSQAKQSYDRAAQIDPDNWEAEFYSVFLASYDKSVRFRILNKALPHVILLIRHISGEEAQVDALMQLADSLRSLDGLAPDKEMAGLLSTLGAGILEHFPDSRQLTELAERCLMESEDDASI